MTSVLIDILSTARVFPWRPGEHLGERRREDGEREEERKERE
jgi:hypothetical protein